jgi:crotonobetainyl-CoA:carnitine CoA-transferase CaiB-like acyl-CoA transferase
MTSRLGDRNTDERSGDEDGLSGDEDERSGDDRVLPCTGLSVVEVAVGASDLGLGLVAGIPGMILGDLGASVTRVVVAAPDIDAFAPWGQAWHRDKEVVTEVDTARIAARLGAADVAIVYGQESDVEGRGIGSLELLAANPSLVYARCRPSRTAAGSCHDFGLLVEARAGFCTQLTGHREGPIFVDVRASGGGAALVLTASVLALLRRRVHSGRGGWAETSLYDGLISTLGCMIGRSERAPTEVESYWEKGSTFPNFLYRCADGELLQVWFGGKGMYAALIEILGDEPSLRGYYADQVSGMLQERARRWRSFFERHPRDVWIERLRDAGVACEPVLAPGDLLTDAHALDVGLVAERSTPDGARQLSVATPIEVRPLSPSPSTDPVSTTPDSRSPAGGCAGSESGRHIPVATTGRLLEGVRVADFSAFVAGPLAAQVLADLGAEVIKVEPPGGEAMRAAAYAVAACQRGKRSLALDIASPEARPVVERLLRWADVVLHNFRVGVSERLGMDEETVARLNPHAVYCHASAFGTAGARATYPGNDALMQALTGFERAVGGAGNDPIAGTWIPIDMCGGWVAAVGVLAGLYGAAATGSGFRVATSLMGAGMLLQSGVTWRDGQWVRGPELDTEQTGYGPGYRIYEGADGDWFAVVIPSAAAWAALRSLPAFASLPDEYVPLRGGPDDEAAKEAEAVFAAAFASRPAAESMATLASVGALAEPVEPMDRDGFRRGILDDPFNRQLGRVATYETPDWGWFEQIGPLPRCGPDAEGGPELELPGIGQHSFEVLTELGFGDDEVQGLVRAKVVLQQ